MTRLVLAFLLFLYADLLFAQSVADVSNTSLDYNLGFESSKPDQPLLEKWSRFTFELYYESYG